MMCTLFYFYINLGDSLTPRWEVIDIIGIGDYDAGMRERRRVVTREGQIMYHGKKYTEERETGYMVCTTGKRERLHDRMWLCEGVRDEMSKDWDRIAPRLCCSSYRWGEES